MFSQKTPHLHSELETRYRRSLVFTYSLGLTKPAILNFKERKAFRKQAYGLVELVFLVTQWPPQLYGLLSSAVFHLDREGTFPTCKMVRKHREEHLFETFECYRASRRVCPFKGVENGHSGASSFVCCYWPPSPVLRVRETVHSLTQSDISVGSSTMATFFQACLACSGWLHTLAACWLGTPVPSVPAFPWGSFISMELAFFILLSFSFCKPLRFF